MTKSEIKSEYQHSVESAIATVGAAISDISRVKILCALMDGRAWTATELGINTLPIQFNIIYIMRTLVSKY